MADFYSTRSLSIQLLLRRYSPHARLFYNPVSPQVTFEFFRARGWLSAGSLGHKRAKERSNWKLEPRFIGIRLYISDVSPFTQTFLPAKPTPSSPNLLPFFFVRFYLTKNFTLLSFFFSSPILHPKFPPSPFFENSRMIRAVECLFLCLFFVELAWRRGGEGRERASRRARFFVHPPSLKVSEMNPPPPFSRVVAMPHPSSVRRVA